MDNYIRRGIYTIPEVLNFAIDTHTIQAIRLSLLAENTINKVVRQKRLLDSKIKYFDGIPVKMNSQRYILFKNKGCNCVSCGLKGSYFALEKARYQKTKFYHFNLYALNTTGNEVMMTKDHIFPKALGGSNKLNNLQPMCSICNGIKGAKLPEISNIKYN